MINKSNERIITILYWNSLYVAFLLLPFGINLPTPFFISAISFGLINIYKEKGKRVYKSKAFFILPFYFLILLLSILFSENTNQGIKLIERSVSMFLFPIIFVFIEFNEAKIKRLFTFLLIGLLLTFFINLVIACANSFSLVAGVLTFDSSIEGNYSFLESFNHGGSYFIGGEFSKLLHPTYVSIYILVILAFMNNIKFGGKKLIFTLLFFYLFLLASRSAFLILVLVSFFLTFRIENIKKRKKLLFLFFLGLVLISFNPRISHLYNRLKNFSNLKHYKYATSEQARILTWDASLRLIKKSPIIGYGIGDANNELIKKFKELDYIYNYKHKFNAHNQFLETLLQTGFIGFIVLILQFYILGVNIRKKNAFFILLILFFSLFFESVLVRFNGIVFYSIILSWLSRVSFVEKENKKTLPRIGC